MMAAAAGKLIFATGFEEIDAKLRAMPTALQRKFVRGALRKGGKRLTQAAKQIIRSEARDTGALEQSVKVKALKRKRSRVGVEVFPERDKLFTKYAAKHEGRQPHPAKDGTEPYYYPAVIEFGNATHRAVSPFRRALYDNAAVYREYFGADVREFIATQKVTTTLTKATGYTGKQFKK